MSDASPKQRRSHRILDLVEASLWVALLVLGGRVALEVMQTGRGGESAAAEVIPGLVEAEDLRVVAKSRDFTFGLQPTSSFRARGWSRGGHMFALGTDKDDWIDLAVPELAAGTYELQIFLTRARDYGIVVVLLDGVLLGTPIDLWVPGGVFPTGPITLGEVELGPRPGVLRIAVTGTNPRASPPYYQFGVDGIRLDRR